MKDFLTQTRDLLDQQIEKFPEPQLLDKLSSPNAPVSGAQPSTGDSPIAGSGLGARLTKLFNNFVDRLLHRLRDNVPSDVKDWAQQTKDLLDKQLANIPAPATESPSKSPSSSS